MKVEPYKYKPEGLFFIGRFPNNKQYSGYGEMVITDDGFLACLCNDGKWYPFRKARKEDIAVATTAFKTWEELQVFTGELLIAA